MSDRVLMFVATLSLSVSVAQAAEVAAVVNGTEISAQRLDSGIDTFLRGLPAGGADTTARQRVRAQVLEAMIGQELLLQAARASGIRIRAADLDAAVARVRDRYRSGEAFAAALREHGSSEASLRRDIERQMLVQQYVDTRVAADVAVSDEDVRAYYQRNEKRFIRPEEVRVQHIFVQSEDDDDADTRGLARDKAEYAHKLLRLAKQDFSAVARKFSEDASAQAGGELGFIGRGVFPRAFEQAAFALKPGEVSDIVESDYGFHIIRVIERRGGELVALDEVAPTVRSYLQGQAVQHALDRHVADLRGKAKVEMR